MYESFGCVSGHVCQHNIIYLKNFMKTLLAEDEQEFFASLCHIGFVVYTDYLMAEREHYLAETKALH